MTAPQTVADVLDAAADLLTPEGAWTQIDWAADKIGDPVSVDDPSATCFCVRGAIMKVSGESWNGDNQVDAAHAMFGVHDSGKLARWNDDPYRTQSEVIAKLREAASLARASASRTQEDGHVG